MGAEVSDVRVVLSRRRALRRLTGLIALVVLLCLIVPADAAYAHKPEQIGDVAEGHAPSSATEIENPQVSQVFYTELRGQADYRKFIGR